MMESWLLLQETAIAVVLIAIFWDFCNKHLYQISPIASEPAVYPADSLASKS